MTLEGCLVGRSDALLSAVSSALGGIAVSGGTGYQHPMIPGLEGGIRTCIQLPGAPAQCTTTRDASAAARTAFAVEHGLGRILSRAPDLVLHLVAGFGEQQLRAAEGGLPMY